MNHSFPALVCVTRDDLGLSRGTRTIPKAAGQKVKRWKYLNWKYF